MNSDELTRQLLDRQRELGDVLRQTSAYHGSLQDEARRRVRRADQVLHRVRTRLAESDAPAAVDDAYDHLLSERNRLQTLLQVP